MVWFVTDVGVTRLAYEFRKMKGYMIRRTMKESSKRIIEVIRGIPEGQVMSYGEVARRAGLANGARMVARILHSSTRTHNLPWHRVVNSQGKISLDGEAYQLQKSLLVGEGIQFDQNDRIDMDNGS